MLQCYELLARMALLINGSLDMDATSRAFAIESAHRMITACRDLEQLKGLAHKLVDYHFTAKDMLAAELLKPRRCTDCPLP